MIRLITFFLFILIPPALLAQTGPTAHLSKFETGGGPLYADGVYQLLDGSDTARQSNAIAFDVAQVGAYEQMTLRCRLRVLAGGDGGAFVFLNTDDYGSHGPAPFAKNWVEPNFSETFAVGIDVHNPQSEDPFDAWGNYQGMPESEVSLHWDGSEIVKRVSPEDFRGNFVNLEIMVQHVIGGAEVTVRIGGETVFDSYFVAGMLPYESRLAIGAGTREDATTEFDVQGIDFTKIQPAQAHRPPKHIRIFNHVKTDDSIKSQSREVILPPQNFAYGRIILTLEMHDARPDWDEWDRNGYVYVYDQEGTKHDILPFITSFRTPFIRKVDVTHFRPWLNGKVKFEIATESGDKEKHGFMMSVSLDFYEGLPKLEVFRVVTLWTGTAKYKSGENHFKDFFTPQRILIDEETEEARLFITTTGHSPVGEFTPSRRTVIFVPDIDKNTGSQIRFENTVWKNDNYLNPTRPQSGSWKYSRAGWAPGDIVQPWWIDLTPYIIPSKTAEFRYEPEPYDFSDVPEEKRPTQEEINQAVLLVRSYLILYRTPQDMRPVPPLLVLEVMEDSNAEKAGIQPGDYIMSYDNIRPDSIEDLREIIRAAEKAGKDIIEVAIYRSPEKITKAINPGRMGILLEEQ